MTNEEIKNLLRNVRSKKSRLKALRAYIDEERALIEGVGAVGYDSLGVVSSVQNGTEERYIKHLDRLKELQMRFDKLYKERSADMRKIWQLMECLSPVEYEVIINRYLRGLSVLETAGIMNYSEDGIYDIQERAIKKMSRVKLHS